VERSDAEAEFLKKLYYSRTQFSFRYHIPDALIFMLNNIKKFLHMQEKNNCLMTQLTQITQRI